eukprot:scaffold14294_cov31-Tisochrysis_lutea.AAC.3
MQVPFGHTLSLGEAIRNMLHFIEPFISPHPAATTGPGVPDASLCAPSDKVSLLSRLLRGRTLSGLGVESATEARDALHDREVRHDGVKMGTSGSGVLKALVARDAMCSSGAPEEEW